jgi:hypothetical protein
MPKNSHIFGENAYLNLAYQALLLERRPVNPKEMIHIARKHDFMPQHLSGETKHKTLSARLSVHIREKSGKSEFFRTAPAMYFLHSLATDPKTPDAYKTVFVGNLRSKTIRKEDVLVINRNVLKSKIDGVTTDN